MFDVTHPVTTLLFILMPLALTFAGQRLFLHLINPNADLYLFGHNVHHLFVGAVMAIPAAFILAFQPETPLLRLGALAALGSGSAMILDELIYLIATDGTNASYLKPISLWSAILMQSLAAGLLLLIYALS
jgi:hypothetical protein